MRIYFAAPLFSTAERDWNAEVAAALREAGHDVFLPQEKEVGKDDAGIFAADLAGLDWAEGVVAIMDGADPDSSTCWEVGYAYGKKPIVLVRTDIRGTTWGIANSYSVMVTGSATIKVDAIGDPTDRVAGRLLAALERLGDLA